MASNTPLLDTINSSIFAGTQQSGASDEGGGVNAPKLQFTGMRDDGTIPGASDGKGITGQLKGAWNDIKNAPSDAVNLVKNQGNAISADISRYSDMITSSMNSMVGSTVDASLANGFADLSVTGAGDAASLGTVAANGAADLTVTGAGTAADLGIGAAGDAAATAATAGTDAAVGAAAAESSPSWMSALAAFL